MLFTQSYITESGALIFARAAAQEGAVVWGRAATSSLNADSYTDAQMAALIDIVDASSEYTSSGAVTNAIVNDAQTSASVHSELTNESYSGVARLFGVWAKIEGDANYVLAIVARCGTDVTPTTINPSSDGVVKAFVDFTLLISAEQAQAIEATESYYATSAALQSEQEARASLAERVVTTHSLSNADVGDNQLVRGNKTFIDSSICRQLSPVVCIDVTDYDSERSRLERINGLRNDTSLGLGLVAAKSLCESIDAAVDAGKSFPICAPTYNVTNDNIDTLLEEISDVGFTCVKATSSVGTDTNPYDNGHFDTLNASGLHTYQSSEQEVSIERADDDGSTEIIFGKNDTDGTYNLMLKAYHSAIYVDSNGTSDISCGIVLESTNCFDVKYNTSDSQFETNVYTPRLNFVGSGTANKYYVARPVSNVLSEHFKTSNDDSVIFREYTDYNTSVDLNWQLLSYQSSGSKYGCQLRMRHSTTSKMDTKNFAALQMYSADDSRWEGFLIEYDQSLGANLITMKGITKFTDNIIGVTTFSDGITGTAPSVNSGNTTLTDVPVGGIVFGVIPSSFTGLSGRAGEVITTPQGSYSINTAKCNSSGNIVTSNRSITAGKYVALMDFEASGGACCLLQRVE